MPSTWDEEFCLDVTIRYWDKARKAGLPVGEDFGDFYRAWSGWACSATRKWPASSPA